jgi:GDP-mannose transporter
MPSSTDEEKKTVPGGKGDYSLVIDTDERKTAGMPSLPASSGGPVDSLLNHPALPVMCYCAASILMTVINKVGPHHSLVPVGMLLTSHPHCPQFVVSGSHFSMNFLLLTIQSSVGVSCVFTCKRLGVSAISIPPPVQADCVLNCIASCV